MAGYIGNKAVGLNVTTGDILGDVGVGGDYFSKSLGTSNLRLGVNAGDSIASGGNFNVCVGDEAGTAITTGDQNTAVGALALNANISSSFNTAVGQESMLKTTGASNTALGDKSMLDNVAGANNVALGASALENNTTADYNTAVGYRAGYTNTTGTNNVSIGSFSLNTNTTGSYNVSSGYGSLRLNQTGGNNTALGQDALRSNTTASNNTAVGYRASYSNTTGTNNTCIGIDSGYHITTGDQNTIIGGYNGNGGGLDIRTSDNNVVLSDGSGNPRIHINSSGVIDVGVLATGIINASENGYILFKSQGSDVAIFYIGGLYPGADNAKDLGIANVRWDDVYATNGSIQTSDRNEKQDIASLTSAEMLVAKRISTLFKTFRWKSKVVAKGDNARTHTGTIAQDVQAAFTAESLDAGDYSLFISSTWWEHDVDVAAVEADDTVTPPIEAADAYTRTDNYDTEDAAPSGSTSRTRLGIRYNELLSFVAAYNEQRFAAIETRITVLENA